MNENTQTAEAGQDQAPARTAEQATLDAAIEQATKRFNHLAGLLRACEIDQLAGLGFGPKRACGTCHGTGRTRFTRVVSGDDLVFNQVCECVVRQVGRARNLAASELGVANFRIDQATNLIQPAESKRKLDPKLLARREQDRAERRQAACARLEMRRTKLAECQQEYLGLEYKRDETKVGIDAQLRQLADQVVENESQARSLVFERTQAEDAITSKALEIRSLQREIGGLETRNEELRVLIQQTEQQHADLLLAGDTIDRDGASLLAGLDRKLEGRRHRVDRLVRNLEVEQTCFDSVWGRPAEPDQQEIQQDNQAG